jgi:hypothetical protein
MSGVISRKGFLAVSGVAAAGLVPLTQTSASEAKAKPDDGSHVWDAAADVIVVGAGFGGMVAAAQAMNNGASVAIVEASPRMGGTALLCSGILGFGGSEITMDVLQASAPMADSALLQTYVDSWPELTKWLLDAGAPIAEVGGNYKFGGEDAVAPDGNVAMADWFTGYLEESGAQIYFSTRAIDLVIEEGAIRGIVAINSDGIEMHIGGSKVILACGGFMGDSAKKEVFMGTFADQLANRGNPHNTGDGMEMGLRAGAALSKGLSTYYGYHLPWPHTIVMTAEEWDANVEDVEWLAEQQGIMSNIQGWSGNCILVNQEGKRYEDESQRDSIVSESTTQQKFSRSYVISTRLFVRTASVIPSVSGKKNSTFSLIAEPLLNSQTLLKGSPTRSGLSIA